MAELRFETSADVDKVQLHLFELEDNSMTVEFLRKQFELTEFRNYWLSEAALNKALTFYRKKLASSSDFTLEEANDHVSLIVAEKRQAECQVEIDDDKMSCRIRIVTAYGGQNPTPENISNLLKDYGVTDGIKVKKLQILCASLDNLAPGTVVKEVLAEGKFPTKSVPAKFEFVVEPIQDRLMQPKLRDDGTVDMHDFGEIQMVEINDVLLKRIPPKKGAPGFDVMGEVVEAPNPADRQIVPGEGTALASDDENVLIATRRGVAMRNKGGMAVEDAYVVQNVDLKTGNIDFDGSVVVRGSVQDGLRVAASGKVLVQDYVESAEIEAGGDVIIGKGLLGRKTNRPEDSDGSASIVCGGDFSANYAQYAQIDAKGTVKLAKHAMHCRIESREIVLASPRKSEGKIIGGTLMPSRRVVCNTLGALSYVATKISFNHIFSQSLAELQDIEEDVSDRIKVIQGMEEALAVFPKEPKDKDQQDQVLKLVNTINHFKNIVVSQRKAKKALLESIENRKSELEIVIKRTLYPGIEVEILGPEFKVKQEKQACKIVPKGDGIAYFTLG